MTNSLSNETSPYLKQHENNPVQWYPWGEEALSKSRTENKPILLSVGYSACHWCHVMAHECFENEEIAQLMNEHFINIKVDREERPDLDQIYQNVAQMFTRGGGWPLTVFLTPDLKPFYGGTYFPPDDRYGRPGFKRLLLALSEAYKTTPEKILENSNQITQSIAELESIRPRHSTFEGTHDQLILKTSKDLLSMGDFQNGGFGHAPKFPNVMALTFLWRMSISLKDKEPEHSRNSADFVVHSLRKMAMGGIYDQVGGGFHRYSVDETWSVPHFEKMLYDNALLLKLYSEVLLTEKYQSETLTEIDRYFFLTTIEETLEYLQREMKNSNDLFFAAQDADSDGEEGTFFVWTPALAAELFKDSDLDLFLKTFGISNEGNFEHSTTVLFRADLTSDLLEREKIKRLKMIAYHNRKHRVAPGLDNKMLTAWNSLLVSGLVYASKALAAHDRKTLAVTTLEQAQKTFRSLKQNVLNSEGRLFATYQGSEARFNAYLDDYAFFAKAAIDLGEFEDAKLFALKIIEQFRDEEEPGYFFTSKDHETLLIRPKSLFDQAIPSGTAVALEVMAIVSEYFADNAFHSEVSQQIASLISSVANEPYGHAEFFNLVHLFDRGPIILKSNHTLEFHPHVFQTPSSETMLCHKQTCIALKEDDALKQIQARLKYE